MGVWNVSIYKLLSNLQGALKALAPWMNLSNIPYSEQSSYDDWDSIAESLYKAIIVNSIAHSKNFNHQNQFPQYDIHYNSYKGLNFIALEQKNNNDHYFAFVSFSGGTEFDLVNYCKIDKRTLQVIERGQIDFNSKNYFLIVNGNFDSREELIIEI